MEHESYRSLELEVQANTHNGILFLDDERYYQGEERKKIAEHNKLLEYIQDKMERQRAFRAKKKKTKTKDVLFEALEERVTICNECCCSLWKTFLDAICFWK